MAASPPPLAPVPGGPDAVLAAFMAASAAAGLTLYPAQEEAILALLEGHHVILETPTGSGKSWVASFAHLLARSTQRRSYYTCPIKALVSEKFFQLAHEFGGQSVGMVTGESQVNPDAPIVVCTQEILAQMALAGDARHRIGLAVMDEFHFYADAGRGVAWQLPLLCLERCQFLLMSATLGDVAPVVRTLEGHGRAAAVHVRSPLRPVPLRYQWRETPLHETLAELVAGGRAPIYVVHFTQRACLEAAQAATSLQLASRDEKRAVAAAHAGFRFDSPFGRDMRRLLGHGIGVHHAGLLPKYRRLVERLAQAGLLKLIMGTDTLGVGINVPIRTVLFTQLCKYDGTATAVLTVRDFRQIAGRAGRRGFDDEGFVVAQAPEHVIENRRAEARVTAQQARGARVKKSPKKRPPERNYVAWDEATFGRLAEAPVAPLVSQFQVGYPMLLSLLQGDHQDQNPYRRLVEVVGRCHDTPARRRHHLRRAATCFQALCQASVVRVRPRPARPRVEVDAALQAHFSLDQALGLWLLDTLPHLDADAPTYPLDVLSLVEAITESPEVILGRQVDRQKRARLAELKAEGVDYEERMAELALITHPKPLAEFIYTSFNLFAASRPWLAGENVRPKGIARELVEGHASFHQYVRELGLERSEGVLLRYLSRIYKTWTKSVPRGFRSEACLELEAFLLAAVTHVDASLLSEWEALVGGGEAAAAPAAPAVLAARLDPAADPRAFARMVRAHLGQVVAALARREWEEAASWLMVAGDDGGAEAGGDAGGPAAAGPPLADQLGLAMQPFLAEHGALLAGAAARDHALTQVTPLGDDRWRVTQVLCDPAGDHDWVLEGVVAGADVRAERVPCITFVRLGR